MKTKSRKQKSNEYEQKFSHIPQDYNTRLEWLYDSLNITDTKAAEILEKRNQMIMGLSYNTILINLYEVPEGSPRPRFRLINRENLANAALSNPSFVHVYSITGAEDNCYMQRLVTQQDFVPMNNIICTPCDVECVVFFKTPGYFNAVDTFLAELGLHRPMTKPDWDNIGKKYSDMFNKNIWLDDSLAIDGTVRKFYSVLPRIEIRLKYMNMLYNRYQYKSIAGRIDDQELTYFGRKTT